MDFHQKRVLGRSRLWCSRIGISSSFGAPAAAYEEAFERGCNYFTWGTFVKGRSGELERALKGLFARGKREKIILAMPSYAHSGLLSRRFLMQGLKKLHTDYADVLILGYYSRVPPRRILDSALEMKEKGVVRFIGITSHHRRLFARLAERQEVDIFHLRYNAVNRGAEDDVFPYLPVEDRPGIVSFTATRWRRLLNQKKMPPGENAPTARECYRFVLSNPHIDVCMMGARSLEQMRENLQVLDEGPLGEREMVRMRRIGDYLYKGGRR